MKQYLICIFLLLAFQSLMACSCPKIKGLNGKHAGFKTMSSILNHTFLIRVSETNEHGINVTIKKDYRNSTKLKELFIQNMDPGFTCSDSTTLFKIGEYYLILLWSDDELTKKNTLSICFESYINVTKDWSEAYIIDQLNPTLKTWSRKQLEESLGFEIMTP